MELHVQLVTDPADPGQADIPEQRNVQWLFVIQNLHIFRDSPFFRAEAAPFRQGGADSVLRPAVLLQQRKQIDRFHFLEPYFRYADRDAAVFRLHLPAQIIENRVDVLSFRRIVIQVHPPAGIGAFHDIRKGRIEDKPVVLSFRILHGDHKARFPSLYKSGNHLHPDTLLFDAEADRDQLLIYAFVFMKRKVASDDLLRRQQDQLLFRYGFRGFTGSDPLRIQGIERVRIQPERDLMEAVRVYAVFRRPPQGHARGAGRVAVCAGNAVDPVSIRLSGRQKLQQGLPGILLLLFPFRSAQLQHPVGISFCPSDAEAPQPVNDLLRISLISWQTGGCRFRKSGKGERAREKHAEYRSENPSVFTVFHSVTSFRNQVYND